MSKAATKVTLNNLYYFNKKTQQFDLTYDQISRAAKFITRANERNKTLGNKQGKTLLTSIADRINSSKNGEIFIDHDWISTITDCLPEQNTKIMGQLADILDFKYHRSVIFEGKKRHYGLIVKFTHDGQKRLTNPELFYDVPSPRKAQKTSEITPKKIEVMTEKNRLYIRDMGKEIPHSYANGGISVSSILETETNTRACDPIQKNPQDKPVTFAPCSLAEQEQVTSTNQAENSRSATSCSQLTSQEEKAIELEHRQRTSKNTGLFAMSDLMAKVLNEPQKEEEVPEMNLEELPELTEKQERTILLSRSLRETFGEQRSGEIQNDYKFVETEPHKVCIQTKAMLLNDIEKAKIRKCLQSVYGEDVTIAMRVLEPIETEQHEQEKPITAKTTGKQNWLKFKGSISDSKLLTILTNRLVKVNEKEETLVIEAAPFFIEELTAGGHLTALEDAIIQTGITLELSYSGLNTSYTNAAKQKITLTPKQIQKDRDWIRIHRKAINELDKK